jgi:uncharacterized protein (DUF2141 family)
MTTGGNWWRAYEIGSIDKNIWGVPIEGYGFSNNAQGSLGPPAFKEVAMTLDEADKEISISLINPVPAEDG